MQDFDFRKETFDLSDSPRYELSIQTGLDGFFFLIKFQKEIILFRHERFSFANENLLLRRIREIYDEQGLSGRTFLKTEIYFSGHDFSLIPQPLFSEKLASRFLTGDTKSFPSNETIVMPLEILNATLAFPVSTSLSGFFREFHPECTIGHEVSLLLRNYAHSASPALFIHLHDSWFYAISFGEKGLIFLNTFRYHSPEDFLYYLLSISTLPELQGTPLWFSGNVSMEHPCFNLTRKYLTQAGILRHLQGSESPLFNQEIPFQQLPGITLL